MNGTMKTLLLATIAALSFAGPGQAAVPCATQRGGIFVVPTKTHGVTIYCAKAKRPKPKAKAVPAPVSPPPATWVPTATMQSKLVSDGLAWDDTLGGKHHEVRIGSALCVGVGAPKRYRGANYFPTFSCHAVGTDKAQYDVEVQHVTGQSWAGTIKVTAEAPPPPWIPPSGYTLWTGYGNGRGFVATMWDSTGCGGSDCLGYAAIGMYITAQKDCLSDLYVRINELDSSGVVIAWTNATTALSAGQTARLLFHFDSFSVKSVQITQIDCF